MRLRLSDDQRDLQRGFREFLAGRHPIERVRELWESDSGRSPDLWNELVELGVVGLTVPEDLGGLGLGEVELAALLDEAGYALLTEPLSWTTAVAVPLLREVDAAAEPAAGAGRGEVPLGAVARGEIVLTVGLERQPLVADAHVASVLLLERDAEWHAIPREEARLVPQPSLARSRRLFSVDWEPSESTLLARGERARAAAESAFDRGALAASAELLGVGRRLVDMTAAYAREREQFGQPIGAFQAVKHLLADALVQVEFARPAVYCAAAAVAGREPNRARSVSLAKTLASDAAVGAGRAALQIHGAIGYTAEQDLRFWLLHAEALARSWGDAAWHVERVASELFS